MKTVFHISQNQLWPEVIANIQNTIYQYGKSDYTIEVVAVGQAILGYIAPELKDDFNELNNEYKVKLSICHNAMNGANVTPDMLESFINIVPAGIYRLIELQENGYSYVKP